MKAVLVVLVSTMLSVCAMATEKTDSEKSAVPSRICGTIETEDYFTFIVSRVNEHRYRIMDNLDTNEGASISENGSRVCVTYKIISSEPAYPDDPSYAAQERALGHQTTYVKIRVLDISPWD